VIGTARTSSNIIYAFGHGHLGLTLAAITSRLVAQLLGERANSAAVSDLAATRFGS
jgi:D-amino-acid dehydrogenase